MRTRRRPLHACHFHDTQEVIKMPKLNDTGLYQLKNGYWGFRYAIVVNNKRVE